MQDTRRNLLIVGAGGFGREALAYIEDDNPLFKVKGFLDSRTDALNATPRDVGICACHIDLYARNFEILRRIDRVHPAIGPFDLRINAHARSTDHKCKRQGPSGNMLCNAHNHPIGASGVDFQALWR